LSIGRKQQLLKGKSFSSKKTAIAQRKRNMIRPELVDWILRAKCRMKKNKQFEENGKKATKSCDNNKTRDVSGRIV
jgi:hypothetical protein